MIAGALWFRVNQGQHEPAAPAGGAGSPAAAHLQPISHRQLHVRAGRVTSPEILSPRPVGSQWQPEDAIGTIVRLGPAGQTTHIVTHHHNHAPPSPLANHHLRIRFRAADRPRLPSPLRLCATLRFSSPCPPPPSCASPPALRPQRPFSAHTVPLSRAPSLPASSSARPATSAAPSPVAPPTRRPLRSSPPGKQHRCPCPHMSRFSPRRADLQYQADHQAARRVLPSCGPNRLRLRHDSIVQSNTDTLPPIGMRRNSSLSRMCLSFRLVHRLLFSPIQFPAVKSRRQAPSIKAIDIGPSGRAMVRLMLPRYSLECFGHDYGTRIGESYAS